MSYLCKYVMNVNYTIIQGIVPKLEFIVFVFLVGDIHSTVVYVTGLMNSYLWNLI